MFSLGTLTLANLIDAGRNARFAYRPLPNVIFAFDWWRGGGGPRLFQWTNLIIHGAAAVSVFLLLVLVLRRMQHRWAPTVGAAFFGAALWACHPIQVQAVTYVVQRMTSLAIESTFIPLEMVFEHRMYLPSIGLAGLVALAAVVSLEGTLRFRLATTAVLTALLILVAGSTALRVPVWRTELSLARNSLEHAPNSARAWSNLGNVLKNLNRWSEVEAPMRKALELDPKQGKALHILAVRLMNMGNLQEADQLLTRRLRLGKVDHYLINSVGSLRLKQGRISAAIHQFQLAVSQEARVPVYRWNLALAYERAGECKRAREQWSAYLTLETNPDSLNAVRRHLKKNYDFEGGSCFVP